MARWLVVVVLACGCRQLWGLDHTPAAELTDSAIRDTNDVGSDSANCFGQLVGQSFCLDALPTGTRSFPASQVIDTDHDPSCEAGIATACVVAGTAISISGTLSATGKRPLVLVALGPMQIDGSVDVSSTTTMTGAGAAPADCHLGTIAMLSGGGAGGSFGGSGGDGGNGMENGGTSGGASAPTSLRGGCNGGDGEGVLPANGGRGGGAVYLYSDESIAVNGAINASGAGGSGGMMSTSCSGAGGGSGGMIVLDAPQIDVSPSALLLASGGGGGQGASSSANGAAGADPQDTGQAQGGFSAGMAGRGGRGSGANVLDGEAGQNNNNTTGGGGGGGAGFILALVPISGKIQPPQQ